MLLPERVKHRLRKYRNADACRIGVSSRWATVDVVSRGETECVDDERFQFCIPCGAVKVYIHVYGFVKKVCAPERSSFRSQTAFKYTAWY